MERSPAPPAIRRCRRGHPRRRRQFPHCVEGLWPLAAGAACRARLFEATLRPHARPAHHGPDGYQPEFTKAVWEYLDILVTDERIRGREMLASTERRSMP